jgi:hypothetical protein
MIAETNATPKVANERDVEADNDDMLIEEIGKLKIDMATYIGRCVVRKIEHWLISFE